MDKRLFIAIDIPDELRCEIRKTELTAKGFKSVNPDQLHITLRFIGNFPENDISELIKKLHEIELPEFELSSTSPGFFPNKKRPSVFFLRFENPRVRGQEAAPTLFCQEAAPTLKSDIDDVLETFGIDRDTREFAPHLTLGRFKKGVRKEIIEELEEKSAKLATTFQVKEFILFSSKITDTGAIHTVEARFH